MKKNKTNVILLNETTVVNLKKLKSTKELDITRTVHRSYQKLLKPQKLVYQSFYEFVQFAVMLNTEISLFFRIML